MIHRMKKTDGSYTYRAYSIRDTGDDGHVAKFLDAFDTPEAATARLVADLAEHIEEARLRTVALRSAIDTQDDDDGVGDWEEAIAVLSRDVADDMYFLRENAKSLLASPTPTMGHEGIDQLHGEAAIEYARRHDMLVQYAELENGNYKEGFPVSLTPGQAVERMPQSRQRWIWVTVPRDTIPDDLPPDVSPVLLPYGDQTPPTAQGLRDRAASYRRMAENVLQFAAEAEERAKALEGGEP